MEDLWTYVHQEPHWTLDDSRDGLPGMVSGNSSLCCDKHPNFPELAYNLGFIPTRVLAIPFRPGSWAALGRLT
jgi:hypothetical protein